MFVSTDGGYVNLDHVAEVQYTADGRSLLFKSADGRALGKMRDAGAIDLEELTAAIVAAAKGATAVSILVCHTDDRPTEDDLFVERVPVVAWRLAFGGAIPVLIEPSVSTETTFIETPDGRLLLPEGKAA